MRHRPWGDVVWSARDVLAAAFVFGYLAVQLFLPMRPQSDPPDYRFRWAMYARVVREPRYSVILADGTVRPIGLASQSPYVRMFRPEFSYEPHLPPHLCAVVPDAVAVLIHRPGLSQPHERRCR